MAGTSDAGCNLQPPLAQEFALDVSESMGAAMKLLALHYIDAFLVGIFEAEDEISGEGAIQVWSLSISDQAKFQRLAGADLPLGEGLEAFVSAYDSASNRIFAVVEYCNGSRVLASLALGEASASAADEIKTGVLYSGNSTLFP